MRLISFEHAGQARLAIRGPRGYVDLAAADPQLPRTPQDLLPRLDELRGRLNEIAASGSPLSDPRLLAPVPNPGKLICVGLNYADHARETGADIPTEPVIFNKFPSAVSRHLAPIVLPPDSTEVDYEAELAAVIGKPCRRISVVDAPRVIAGYCCANDVSARDWQKNKPGKQWLLGKTFDTFAPFGPELVTADEVEDPNNLRVVMRISGETLQDSSTSQFIFNVAEVVSYVSRVCTLHPGDVIFTGTPPGVGVARKPPRFLKPGDICDVEITGLGVLKNPVIAEA